MNILVLCHGNINRSPLVHALLRKYLHHKPGISVQSAGFVNPGRRASKKMRDYADNVGVNLEHHRSQLCTAKLVEWADKIIYMDGGNLGRLVELVDAAGLQPLSETNKLVSLGAFASPPRNRIPDPAFIKRDTQEFADVVALMDQCVQNWIRTGALT